MSTQQLTEDDMLLLLNERLRSAGSQRALATELRVSGQYVNDLVKGRRPISAELAHSLGYTRKVVFEAIETTKG